MYTKGILTRYADGLEQSGRTIDAADFRSALSRITFEIANGVEVCMGGAVSDVLEGTSIECLIADLAQRWHEFATPEDLKSQEEVV
ncbi:hypothetical protein KA071_02555 [Candidatus Gracilibacteria bacterium]|nr:hypothetical protein [Candidatus Gracilibacteria bacterium]